jgi:hypothetical protein
VTRPYSEVSIYRLMFCGPYETVSLDCKSDSRFRFSVLDNVASLLLLLFGCSFFAIHLLSSAHALAIPMSIPLLALKGGGRER